MPELPTLLDASPNSAQYLTGSCLRSTSSPFPMAEIALHLNWGISLFFLLKKTMNGGIFGAPEMMQQLLEMVDSLSGLQQQ